MQSIFENTAVAYAGKSDKALRRSYVLFRLMSLGFLVHLGSFVMLFLLRFKMPLRWVVKPTIFKQFCGGENIEEALQLTHTLQKNRVGAVLDYAAEGMDEEKKFEKTKDEILTIIQRASHTEGVPFAVFKMSGLARFALLEKVQLKTPLSDAEKKEFENVLKRVKVICAEAHAYKVPVFIDAEESWIQDTIDQIAYEMMAFYNKEKAIVYNTLQMYRHDRLEHLKKMHNQMKGQCILGFKLVRGAYMEKERKRAVKRGYISPVHESKSATDTDFNEAVSYILGDLDSTALCVATHNEESMLKMMALMQEKKIASNTKCVYVAQLFGMGDNISFNMAQRGYNVAKYVPYGEVETVVPYLIRRAVENTSVAGQTGRELSLIKKEINRRKLNKKDIKNNHA